MYGIQKIFAVFYKVNFNTVIPSVDPINPTENIQDFSK